MNDNTFSPEPIPDKTFIQNARSKAERHKIQDPLELIGTHRKRKYDLLKGRAKLTSHETISIIAILDAIDGRRNENRTGFLEPIQKMMGEKNSAPRVAKNPFAKKTDL